MKISKFLDWLLLMVLPLVFSWSPSGGYAPASIDCPEGPLIRPANKTSNLEREFLPKRRKITKAALLDLVERIDIDFDAKSIIDSADISIGIALSGGGLRGMFVEAGQIAAMDNRTPGSNQPNHLGGLLQASTYVTALSGSAWLLSSMYMNNFTTVHELAASRLLWNFAGGLFNPGVGRDPGGTHPVGNLVQDILDKTNVGFHVTTNDLWGRILSRVTVDLDNGGPSLEWSDMTQWKWFQNGEAPFPIVLLGDRNSPHPAMYELTPDELGSYDPSVFAFTPLRYLGSKVKNGYPNGTCIAGFGTVSFLVGAATSAFDSVINRGISDLGGSLGDALLDVFGRLVKKEVYDLSIVRPNPFDGYQCPYNLASNFTTGTDTIYLADCGFTRQVIPFQPLLLHERAVDVIFASDNTLNTEHFWPAGLSMGASYHRQFEVQVDFENPVAFPHVPDSNTFINKGLVNEPTFFGCNASNLTSLGPIPPPLIVYMANQPYTYWTNTSTSRLLYNRTEIHGFLNNGYNIMTQMNGTMNSEWTACVICAVVHRENERRGIEPSPLCQRCLNRYCWDGSLDPIDPEESPNYSPRLRTSNIAQDV
jgi:lysophospholipase